MLTVFNAPELAQKHQHQSVRLADMMGAASTRADVSFVHKRANWGRNCLQSGTLGVIEIIGTDTP
jgi:hypothetical protein